MSSKFVSSAEQTLHLCSNHNQSTKKPLPDNTSVVSFISQATRPRISIKRASFGPSRARISAFHSPAAETPYQLLGIAESEASASDIKKAYKKMARLYHPDVSPPDRVEEYTRRFIMVQQAYQALSNPHSRGLVVASPPANSRQYNQERAEKGVWRSRWESQLDELERRRDSRGNMSWGARMRSQT